MRTKTRLIVLTIVLIAALIMVVGLSAGAFAAPATPGQTVLTVKEFPVGETVYPSGVVITDAYGLTAPEGYTLTMTVNGVETGQMLATTKGTDTIFVPGPYVGKVVFTVAEETFVYFSAPGPPGPPGSTPPPPIEYLTRQALYVGESGPDWAKSVASAVIGGQVRDTFAKNIKITSTGDCFNGLFLAGDYGVSGLKLTMNGDGRSDFVGYGAAVLVTGADTRVVLDGADIQTDGVVRTGIVADEGANLVVKNSTIRTKDGVLPADYNPTMDQLQMRSVPWVLGLGGNSRASNLCGTDTIASYINSTISAEGWGVLSTDDCKNPQLNVINSVVKITGEDGYGTYGIGNATERFLGATFEVATYAAISRGSNLHFGDSDKAAVAALNDSCDLGLTAKELAKIPAKATTVDSDRFGIMWHGDNNYVRIDGGTVFNTGEAVFLDKGYAIKVDVDGSEGAKLLPANGVIFQLMDDDDPGPDMGPPPATNTGEFFKPYVEPITPVVPGGKDLYAADPNDAYLNLQSIALEGDFWNGMRGDQMGGMGPLLPRNLVLTFEDSTVVGVISSSTATHAPHTTIYYPYGSGDNYPNPVPYDYRNLGTVTNTPSAAINNGVIVTLAGESVWTVTGTCYLTTLAVGADALVTAAAGYELVMTVGGTTTTIEPGQTYTGTIMLELVQLP